MKEKKQNEPLTVIWLYSRQNPEFASEKVNVDTYLESKKVPIPNTSAKLKSLMINPIQLFDSHSTLLFYLSNEVAYKGSYQNARELLFSGLEESDSIHC